MTAPSTRTSPDAASESRRNRRDRTRTFDGMEIYLTGVDRPELDRVFAAGHDHGGNPIQPFVDEAGGWPLRCCLADSRAGDRLAIIAWSPMPWRGAYAETGPVVVHADGCADPGPFHRLPTDLDRRAMTLRPYGRDRRIAYHRVRQVAADDSLTDRARELLEFDDVEFVHGRNVTGGCYAFTACRRSS